MEHLVFLTALSDLHAATFPSASPRPVITINNNMPLAILFSFFFHKPFRNLQRLDVRSAWFLSCPSLVHSLAQDVLFFFFIMFCPFLAWLEGATALLSLWLVPLFAALGSGLDFVLSLFFFFFFFPFPPLCSCSYFERRSASHAERS